MLITLLLAVVGIVVGFGEGIVDLVEGLVRLVWGIVKWFSYLILGFVDNGQKFEQYNKGNCRRRQQYPRWSEGARARLA